MSKCTRRGGSAGRAASPLRLFALTLAAIVRKAALGVASSASAASLLSVGPDIPTPSRRSSSVSRRCPRRSRSSNTRRRREGAFDPSRSRTITLVACLRRRPRAQRLPAGELRPRRASSLEHHRRRRSRHRVRRNDVHDRRTDLLQDQYIVHARAPHGRSRARQRRRRGRQLCIIDFSLQREEDAVDRRDGRHARICNRFAACDGSDALARQRISPVQAPDRPSGRSQQAVDLDPDPGVAFHARHRRDVPRHRDLGCAQVAPSRPTGNGPVQRLLATRRARACRRSPRRTRSTRRGQAPTSDSFTPTAAGVYHVIATYNGDASTTPRCSLAAMRRRSSMCRPAAAAAAAAAARRHHRRRRRRHRHARLRQDRHRPVARLR